METNNNDNPFKRWEMEDKEREYQREYKKRKREYFWEGSGGCLSWIVIVVIIVVLLKACSGVSSDPLPNDWDGDGDNNWDEGDLETYYKYKLNQ